MNGECTEVLEKEYYYYYGKLVSEHERGVITDSSMATLKDAFKKVFSIGFLGYSLEEQVEACVKVSIFIQSVWLKDPTYDEVLVYRNFFSEKLYAVFTQVLGMRKQGNLGRFMFSDSLKECVNALTTYPRFSVLKHSFTLRCFDLIVTEGYSFEKAAKFFTVEKRIVVCYVDSILRSLRGV